MSRLLKARITQAALAPVLIFSGGQATTSSNRVYRQDSRLNAHYCRQKTSFIACSKDQEALPLWPLSSTPLSSTSQGFSNFHSAAVEKQAEKQGETGDRNGKTEKKSREKIHDVTDKDQHHQEKISALLKQFKQQKKQTTLWTKNIGLSGDTQQWQSKSDSMPGNMNINGIEGVQFAGACNSSISCTSSPFISCTAGNAATKCTVSGGGSPEINVQGNGVSIVDGDTTPSASDHTDFGSHTEGDANLSRTFTIQNTGSGDLDLTGSPNVSISGSSDFSVTSQPGSDPISAAGSTTFVVQLDPTTVGTQTATISIANDDSDENPYNFNVEATISAATPTITSATYNASTGDLVVTGTNFEANGSGSDVDVSDLTLTGEGGNTYTLATSSDVEITSATEFTVAVSGDDKTNVDGLLNKNGTVSDDSTTYNLAAADDFITNVTSGNTADSTNAITVSSVSAPSITSATYDVNSGVLVVTGTQFVNFAGATNDVDISTLTLTGEGSGTHTITSSSDVEITSATSFSITLSGSDKTNVDSLLNNNGTSSDDSATYNLAAADNWLRGAAASTNIADATNGITVSNAPDNDGSLTAAVGVTEPIALNWSVDTVGEAVDLFDFTLSDGGSSDGLAMLVSQIVLNVTGTASDTDRDKITWRLNGSDASNVTGTYNAGSDTITFSGLSISVADGGNETYTINGYFNDNTNLTHGNTVVLSVDGDTDLTIGSSGTQMGSTSAITNSTGTVFTDNLGPIVSSVSVPANNTYTTGANLDFTVNFNENVTVNTTGGTPRIALTVGSTTRYADYLSGSGTTALIFRHTVQSGDQDSNGVALGATIDPNSGTLRDGVGNDINTTLNSVGSLSSVLIDAVAPAVTEATAVTTPTTDSTPNVQISSTEAGTLAVGGSCGSGDEGAISSGNTTITLTQTDNSTPLASGTYSDCTAMVTDSAGNISNTLTLSSFIVDATVPTLNTNTGKSLNEGDTGVIISNTELSASDNVSTATNVVYTLITAPSNGTLRNDGTALSTSNTFTQADIDNSDITYDHDGSETTSDTLTFTVTDGAGNVNNNSTSNFTLTFTITPVNDAPATNADSDTTNEDNAVLVDVLANDTDVDGSLNAASVTVTSAPSNGTTSVNTGTGVITYTPTADFEGIDNFAYTVEDNNMLASSATSVTITVNAQNDAPVAVADAATTDQDTLVSINVAANDTDVDSGDSPDASTIAIVSNGSNGSAVFNGTTNQIDYTPNTSFTGADTFTYTIEDSSGTTSNVATVTVTVTDPNNTPVVVDDSVSTDEDNAVDISVLANDSDSDGSLDPASLTVISSPSNGAASVNSTTGIITYTPNANFNGSDSFTYSVQDNDGASSSTATVSITVNAVNDAPSANDDAVSLLEDASLTINVLGNDSDADGSLDATSVSVITAPSSGITTVQSNGTIVYTPINNFAGNDSFTYQVSDDLGLASNSATVTLTISAMNDAPLANDDNANVIPGTATSIDLLNNDSDIDGLLDVLSIEITNTPSQGSLVDHQDGTVTYTPHAGLDVLAGDSFTYTVQDDAAVVSNSATVNITFVPPAMPSISGTPDTVAEYGESYLFTPTTSVSDGFGLSYSVENLPSWAMFDTTTGTLSGVPSLSDRGQIDNIIIHVSDGFTTVSLPAFSIQVMSNEDSDGDTIGDEQESLDGTDPLDPLSYQDLTPPDFTSPQDKIFDAEGLFTQISLAQLLSLPNDATTESIQSTLATLVSDNVDGAGCCQPTALDSTEGIFKLAPGIHEIRWQATDNKGNSSIALQNVYIRPLVSLSKDDVTVEGTTIEVSVILNGTSPFYPLEIPYVIDSSSTATTDDHDLIDGTVTLNSDETTAYISVDIIPDSLSEADEYLVIRLDDRTSDTQDLAQGFNADMYDINSGVKHTYQLTITEQNIAPEVDLSIQQDGKSSIHILADGGMVTLTATTQDPNPNDTVTLDWSATDSTLSDSDGHLTNETFVFDPSNLAEGHYRADLTVTDASGATDNAILNFLLVSELPELMTTMDSDGDGIDDLTEGTSDSDEDGIPDYLDNIAARNVLPETVHVTDSFLLECDPGVKCALGQFSLQGQSGGARLGNQDIEALADLSDDDVFTLNEIFDFEIAELPEQGQSASITIPLNDPIPENAVYRKFIDDQWQTFVEDNHNALSSTLGSLGVCPPPGDNAWQAGLTEGDLCVQLTIEDGGPNDSDQLVNGRIADPGGIAVISTSDVTLTTRGGAIHGWHVLVLLGLLLFRKPSRLTLSRQKPSRLKQKTLILTALLLPFSANSNGDTATDKGWYKDWYKGWYVTVERGRAFGSSGADDIEDQFSDAGVPLQSITVDKSRMMSAIGFGYFIHPQWALELGYVDLGDVEVNLSATVETANLQAFYNQAETIHPLSGRGYNAIIQHTGPLSDQLDYVVRAGLFRWRGRFTTNHDIQVGNDKQSGIDPILSLGVSTRAWKGENATVDVRALISQYKLDGEDVRGVSLGLVYYLH